jgi:hypothetical protein
VASGDARVRAQIIPSAADVGGHGHRDPRTFTGMHFFGYWAS